MTLPLTLEYVRNKCLEIDIIYCDNYYNSAKEKHKFKCKKCKNVWQSTIHYVIFRDVRCQKCKEHKPHIFYNYEMVVKLCNDVNIEYLDNYYDNSLAKHNFKCKTCNLIWTATFSRIINCNNGCPFCSRNRTSLEKVNKICENENFIFLDNKYIDQITKYHFMCSNCSRINTTTFRLIMIKDSTCYDCRNRLSKPCSQEILNERIKLFKEADDKERITNYINDLCAEQVLKNIKEYCLTKNLNYIDNFCNYFAEPHNFNCITCNHLFISSWQDVIKVEEYNKDCFYIPPKPTLEQIKEECVELNVNFLDNHYNCASEKHNFYCLNCKKDFISTMERLRKYAGKPCKHCKETWGENFVRKTMEELFPGYSFPKIKPECLRNPKTKRKLELDGFCKELMLAFEYQGLQHFETGRFNFTDERLMKQQKRDEIKRQLCKENGITLIEIPEIYTFIEKTEVRQYIIDQLKLNNIAL